MIQMTTAISLRVSEVPKLPAGWLSLRTRPHEHAVITRIIETILDGYGYV